MLALVDDFFTDATVREVSFVYSAYKLWNGIAIDTGENYLVKFKTRCHYRYILFVYSVPSRLELAATYLIAILTFSFIKTVNLYKKERNSSKTDVASVGCTANSTRKA